MTNDVDERGANNAPRAGLEMLADVDSTSLQRIVEVAVQRDYPRTSSYSADSMTQREFSQIVNEIREFLAANGQKVDGNGHGPRIAKRPRHGDVEAVNDDQGRQRYVGSDWPSEVQMDLETVGVFDEPAQSRERKRARKDRLRVTLHESLEPLGSGPTTPLLVVDREQIMQFYRRILNDGHQALCKKLAKWWIKAILPNKQSSYPYAQGSVTSPWWWVPTPPKDAQGHDCKGTFKNGCVRHLEPDHLTKQERLILLPHILDQVANPRNKTRFYGVDVDKLRQMSIQAIDHERGDQVRNDSWKRFVAEMFRVALIQERFRAGDIENDTTAISVLQEYGHWRPPVTSEADRDRDSEDDGIDQQGPTPENTPESTPESTPERDAYSLDRLQPHSSEGDATLGHPSYVHDSSSRLHSQSRRNIQPPCERINNIPNQLAHHLPCDVQAVPFPASNQLSNMMLPQHYSHTFESHPFHPVFQAPSTSESSVGHILAPFYTPTAIPVASIIEVPTSQNTAMYPIPNTAYPTPMSDPSLDSRGDLLYAFFPSRN